VYGTPEEARRTPEIVQRVLALERQRVSGAPPVCLKTTPSRIGRHLTLRPWRAARSSIFSDFGHNTICVHRKQRQPPAVFCSLRHPRPASCARCAQALAACTATRPSVSVPRKLVFSSIVVKPSAPSGRCAIVA
jgi:hypothetical protein